MEFICNCGVPPHIKKKNYRYDGRHTLIEAMNTTIFQWGMKWTSKEMSNICSIYVYNKAIGFTQ